MNTHAPRQDAQSVYKLVLPVLKEALAETDLDATISGAMAALSGLLIELALRDGAPRHEVVELVARRLRDPLDYMEADEDGHVAQLVDNAARSLVRN